MKKDVGDVIDAAMAAGFEFTRRTGTGHYKLTHANGDTIVVPSSPSGSRWKKNALADIRRIERKEADK